VDTDINYDMSGHELLREHAQGLSLRQIASRHGCSHEHVRKVVLREASRFIDGIELDLMVAWKLEQMGRAEEAKWPVFMCPHGPDWSTAIATVQWCVDQLRTDRGLDVHVTTKPHPEGALFALTITTLGGHSSCR
jgi:hypothetical protein